MENQLHTLLRTIGSWHTKPRSGIDKFELWRKSLDNWATLNGIRRTNISEFGLKSLATGKGLGGACRRPWEHEWPARDHYSYYHRQRRAAAIVTEPYPGNNIAELREMVRRCGLVLQAPPNPFASFWYPGWTVFLVITRRDFGPVQWLPDQLSFEECTFGPPDQCDTVKQEVLDYIGSPAGWEARGG